jgi:pimeloyl-ACP methyl ester carboxylesterase
MKARLHALRRQAQLRSIPDAGHLFFLEQPELTAAALCACFDEARRV